jgi:hypothetical protein
MQGAAPLAQPVSQACSVEIVTDASAFERLEPEWNEAVERAGIAHPFLRHEWLWTWWECFGQGRRLHIVIVRAGARIVAIAPLLSETVSLCGIPVRQLRLMFNDHTPRADVIVAEPGERAYRAIWKALVDTGDRWDVLLLGQISGDSKTREVFTRLASEDGRAIGVWKSSDSPYLELAGTWDSYFGGLPGKFRSNVRNRISRLSARDSRRSRRSTAGRTSRRRWRMRFDWRHQAGSCVKARRSPRARTCSVSTPCSPIAPQRGAGCGCSS